MLRYVTALAALVHGYYGYYADSPGSSALEHLYQQYEADFQAQTTCYTYMTTVLVAVPSSSSCTTDADGSNTNGINQGSDPGSNPTQLSNGSNGNTVVTSGTAISGSGGRPGQGPFPAGTASSNSAGNGLSATSLTGPGVTGQPVGTGNGQSVSSPNGPASSPGSVATAPGQPVPSSGSGSAASQSGLSSGSLGAGNTASAGSGTSAPSGPQTTVPSGATGTTTSTAPPLSSVILSVEVDLSDVNITRRGLEEGEEPRLIARDDPPPPSNSSTGFVGNSTNPSPDECTNAQVYIQGRGELHNVGKAISVNPGVPYINIADFPGGSISTTFSVVNGILVWRNESFYNGTAGFCQVNEGDVYATFTQDGGPFNCTSVNLVVYTVNRCQAGEIVNSPDSPTTGTSSGASTQLSSGGLDGSSTPTGQTGSPPSSGASLSTGSGTASGSGTNGVGNPGSLSTQSGTNSAGSNQATTSTGGTGSATGSNGIGTGTMSGSASGVATSSAQGSSNTSPVSGASGASNSGASNSGASGSSNTGPTRSSATGASQASTATSGGSASNPSAGPPSGTGSSSATSSGLLNSSGASTSRSSSASGSRSTSSSAQGSSSGSSSSATSGSATGASSSSSSTSSSTSRPSSSASSSTSGSSSSSASSSATSGSTSSSSSAPVSATSSPTTSASSTVSSTSSTTSSTISGNYTTITAGYTGTVVTSTTILPSGTVQGTVIIQTPLPTLNCDPSGYLIQITSLYRVNITTGNATLVNGNVGDGRSINAIGYNLGDNFIYGAIGNYPSNLIRISASGDSNILGSLNLTSTTGNLNSGDVDENLQYWGTAGGKFWLQIDLKPGSATFGTTVANGTATFPNTVIDWAYVPGGGNYLYGLAYTSTNDRTILARFDRTGHTWTSLTDFGRVAGQNTWGAVYASDDGFLYGSENNSGEIWKFPLPANGTTPVKISNGPKASGNDGARCIKAHSV
ncbi:hypothetical protein F4779DRAFT_134189 [Xylariaceae sp. FL0662B]|nr:hypothetical protein F4779DRAFT_134189 [Xylariaceae sp. FL0662B]